MFTVLPTYAVVSQPGIAQVTAGRGAAVATFYGPRAAHLARRCQLALYTADCEAERARETKPAR